MLSMSALLEKLIQKGNNRILQLYIFKPAIDQNCFYKSLLKINQHFCECLHFNSQVLVLNYVLCKAFNARKKYKRHPSKLLMAFQCAVKAFITRCFTFFILPFSQLKLIQLFLKLPYECSQSGFGTNRATNKQGYHSHSLGSAPKACTLCPSLW